MIMIFLSVLLFQRTFAESRLLADEEPELEPKAAKEESKQPQPSTHGDNGQQQKGETDNTSHGHQDVAFQNAQKVSASVVAKQQKGETDNTSAHAKWMDNSAASQTNHKVDVWEPRSAAFSTMKA